MTVPKPLCGRVAVMTSGGTGIGAGCTRALAAPGAAARVDVALLVHEETEAAARVAADAVGCGRRVTRAVADVGVGAKVEQAFGEVRASLGTPVCEMEADAWERLLRIDLTGSVLASRRFVRDLGGRGGGGIMVNVTSIHIFAMCAGGADYAAAKGGQANLTRTMALECARMRITVNAIAPGVIDTPMNAGRLADQGRLTEFAS